MFERTSTVMRLCAIVRIGKVPTTGCALIDPSIYQAISLSRANSSLIAVVPPHHVKSQENIGYVCFDTVYLHVKLSFKL